MNARTETGRDDAVIVRAESLAAWRDGERFLESARLEAEALLAQARTEAEALREQARQQGLEQGRKDAMDEAAALALRISAERDTYLVNLEPRLAQVIDMAVRKLLADIPEQSLVALAARKAIFELRESGRFTLRVAPGIPGLLGEEVLRDLTEAVVLREDDQLQAAQCFLETPAGIIELSPDAQWTRILGVLRQDGAEEA